MSTLDNVGRSVQDGNGAILGGLFGLELMGRGGGRRVTHSQRADFNFETHKATLQGALEKQQQNHAAALRGIDNKNASDMSKQEHRQGMANTRQNHAHEIATTGNFEQRNQAASAASAQAHQQASSTSDQDHFQFSQQAKQAHQYGMINDRMHLKEGARQFDATHALKEKAFNRANDALDLAEGM